MLLHLQNVLTREELSSIRAQLGGAEWRNGKSTAGQQSEQAKRNLQIDGTDPLHRPLRETVLRALGRNPMFNSAALPWRIVPPLFNRYDAGMFFEAHVDNAVRPIPESGGARIRTDISATLFLSDPDDYDGGELVLSEAAGPQEIKLPAGDMVLYDTTVLHSVREITRGSRWASFFWIQSMVRSAERRQILFDLDLSIMDLRARLSDRDDAVLRLVNSYHNLMRQWCEC